MGEGRARARRVRRLGVAAACACALIGLPGLSGPSGTGRAVAADPAFDAYGGWAGTTEVATGFFRTQQVDGRWWLIDPEGHPFFSNGINHVVPEGTPDRNGHAAYHEAILAKHGTEEAWADAQVERFDRDIQAAVAQALAIHDGDVRAVPLMISGNPVRAAD